MSDRDLISRSALIAEICEEYDIHYGEILIDPHNFADMVKNAPTVDAVEVTAAELKHLINDTITYIWGLEDSGFDKPEFGYDSRKALLEKLKKFEKEHFPEFACSCGERNVPETNVGKMDGERKGDDD